MQCEQLDDLEQYTRLTNITSSEFNKIPFHSDAFSAFHINIRSLPKHFDDLSEYLRLSSVTVSETWLHISLFLVSLIFLATISSPIQENIN